MGRRTPVHVEIIIYDQSQVERMIKKFSRKVKKSGIFDILKEKQHFTNKSVKNRLKRKNKKRLSQLSTEKYKEKSETRYN
jgi:ribosomal protein S21